MIAVIFEFTPAADERQRYFDLVAEMAAALDGVDGFIAVERFESLTTPGRYLSLSTWRDEAAVTAWRNRPDHRQAQRQGREAVFDDYRLRVAAVLRDYGKTARGEAPADSRAAHGG